MPATTQSSAPTTSSDRAGAGRRTGARRLRPPRQRRRRVQALRNVLHHDPRPGHPRAGRRHLRREPLLARTAHPDQPELQAFDGPRRPGGGRRPRSGLRRRLPRERPAAVPLQAPGAGRRARRGGRELHGDDRHGIREVALLLHPHRRPRSAGAADERAPEHERRRRLSDERARELPDGGARQVHRSGAGRPADHVRPLHGAGRRRRAEAGRGRGLRTSCSPTS